SSDYIVYNNANQPIDPSSVIIANGGDLTFDVTLAGNIDKTDADGYLANVYEVNDQGGLDPTDISNMTFDRDDEGNLPPIAIGGSYQTTGSDGKPVKDSNSNPVTHGLTGGNTYVVGITAYKYVYDDKDGDGQTDDTVYGIVFGNEVLSGPVQLLPPSPPNITISAAVPFVTVTTGAWQQRLDENGDTVLDADGNPILIRTFVNDDVFKTADVSFDVISDVNISGIWYVDNFELEGDFTDTDGFNIALTGLSDGKHTLEIAGADADGDGFRREKVFTVDTQAPNLLLSAPINGSLFGEDGKLNIKGISDKDALFTIEIDGEERAGWVSKTINQMGGTINDSGVFDMEISVDPGVSKHHLVIKAADAVGNTSSASANVQNAGLSNIESL
ncbi:MAG TPA: hypothetical protein P5535_08955, partial [Clostridia bacterium]|nr:hypothetical protein [Clostridia bacterium]